MGLAKRKRIIISLKKKDQIIAESFIAGKVVSEVARSHGISAKILYNWRRKYRANETRVLKVPEVNDKSKSSFVELAISEEKFSYLKKAELIFNDVSLLIEGRVSSSKLYDIIKLLER